MLLQAGLATSFGAGERDKIWLLKGNGEAFDETELRSSVLPLVGVSESLSCVILVVAGLLGVFLILLVALVTQMTLRQVERWN